MNQSATQKAVMIRDFVNLFQGQYVESMKLQQCIYDRWGLRVDWHIFSNELDNLHRAHLVRFTGHTNSGLRIYYIKEPS